MFRRSDFLFKQITIYFLLFQEYLTKLLKIMKGELLSNERIIKKKNNYICIYMRLKIDFKI